MSPNLEFNWSIKKEASDLVIESKKKKNESGPPSSSSFPKCPAPNNLNFNPNTNSNCDGLFVCSDDVLKAQIPQFFIAE